MANKLVVQLKKGLMATPDRQRRVLLGLGLRRIGQTRELPNVPATRGMVKKVIHLLNILKDT